MNAPLICTACSTPQPPTVEFSLDGKHRAARAPNETIWTSPSAKARRIPHLCHKEGPRARRQLPRLRRRGRGRAHAGRDRAAAASAAGMKVNTQSDRP